MNVFVFITITLVSNTYNGFVTDVETVTQGFESTYQCQIVAPQMARQIEASYPQDVMSEVTTRWTCFDAVNHANQKKD